MFRDDLRSLCMEFLRIAGASLNQTPLDVAGNTERILAAIRRAREQEVQLLCLPELCISGYGCEDAFFSPELSRSCEWAVETILKHTTGLTVVVGFPFVMGSALYNCAGVLQDGRILGIHPKRVLAREGVHYEPRWFRPWEFGRAEEISYGGERVPFGDLIYSLGSFGMAVEICEEAWTNIPGAAAVSSQVQLVVNPSASHFALGKYQTRENLVANSSRALHATYLYTNLLGCEAGRLIYDGGVLIAEKGQIVARGPRFGFQDGYLTYFDCCPESATVEKIKHQSVYHETSRDFGFGITPQSGVHYVPGVLRVAGLDPRGLKGGGPSHPHEDDSGKGTRLIAVARESDKRPADQNRPWEFLQAEMLGLFDYLRKSHHRGFVVSLSGGVDSTSCAVLVAHMIAAGLGELGSREFGRRLGLPEEQLSSELQGTGPRAWVRRLLLCVYQKTAQSGPVTEKAAREVAEEIGCEFHICDVESIVRSYVALAENSLKTALNWTDHDIPLQNIQARVRAPLPWLYANLRRSLLLTTSNRSEAAVGYATMDGDTAGGLAPLAGIDKPFLRDFLRWAQRPENLPWLPFGPIAALDLVNAQSPTAELRPQSPNAKAQTDEDDLMPYPVLERIERYLIRDRLGKGDIVQLLARDFPDRDPGQLTVWVERFMKLWVQSQWKRERFAPSFHIDELSLDPKSYCRFPILSG
jgi:NAD+ synthase (glutamine-hydrolysing)